MPASLIPLILWGITTSVYAQTLCTEEGSVRLVGLSSTHAGIVEVCHNGVWGTICGESDTEPWAEKNAQVVCRQLGYSGALNSILQDTLPVSARASNSTPVHYYGFICFGNELALTDCLEIIEVGPNDDCPHENDVAITCRSTMESNAHVGDVRLGGNSGNGHGGVQLFDESFGWIDVCSDSTWGGDEANVVCRQLGYESGTARTYIYSIATSSYTAHSFSCNPDHDGTINDCTYLTGDSCPSFLLGGVECSSSSLEEGSIRLAGSDLTNEGRVEILYNGRWGTLCNSCWDDMDGKVACQQLGFDCADTSSSGIYGDPSNVKPTWLTKISCSSNDLKLSGCDHGNPIGYTNCLSGDAELKCSSEVPISSSVDDSSGLSPGAIVGIALGAIIYIIIMLVIIFWKWIWKSCNQNKTLSQDLSTVEADEQFRDGKDTEFTKVPPPSYRAASSFPTADNSTDLPPPYPGPPNPTVLSCD